MTISLKEQIEMDSLVKPAVSLLKSCMGVSTGETVLVVDDDRANAVSHALLEAAARLGAEPVRVTMGLRERSGQEPPAPVAAAMAAADVVLMPTSFSLSHTRARTDACAAGARVASMPGITPDMFRRAGETDYSRVSQRSIALANVLDAGDVIRITSPIGTDLTLRLGDRRATADTGAYVERGSFGNLPAGEAYIAPLEDSAEGSLVVDASMAGLGVVGTPITFAIRGGRVIEVTGDGSAILRAAWLSAGENANVVAELGVGTNDTARVIGRVLEDEKVFGTVHIAFGNNVHFGGANEVPYHADGVITRATMEVDGAVVIRDGLPVF